MYIGHHSIYRRHKITDETLSHIGQNFRLLSSLQNLTLDFSRDFNQYKNIYKYLSDILRCQKITDVALNYLGHGFKSLSSLKNLTLKLNK